MTDQEARETIEIRALLEGHNARLAARRQDKEVIKRIEAVLKKGVRAVANKHFDQLAELNQAFHHELYAAGQNTVLGEILDKLRDRTAMLFAPGDPSRQARNWEDHAAILRAVIQADEGLAATLATEHVMRAGYDYLLGTSTIDSGLSQLGGLSTSVRNIAPSAMSSRAEFENRPKKETRTRGRTDG